jgi:hypothetical protein
MCSPTKSPIRRVLLLVFSVLPVAASLAEPIIPTKPGTTWQYNMIQEVGERMRLSDLKPDADGKVRATVTYRIDGTEQVDGKELLKFEMHRAGVVTNTDLITVDERGIICFARIGLDGETTKLDPPQRIVPAPLGERTSWDYDVDIADAKVHQHFSVIGDEDVDLPAGKFRAFHIHGEQNSPNPMTIDRWFVPGTGIVKDVTTTRSEGGELVRRISLELKERPKIAPRPEVKPPDSRKKLSVALGTEAIGKTTDKFGLNTPKIYARWQGHGLPDQAEIRVVWIAENIGDIAPRDYTIDEATTTATAPDSHGIFTLSRPDQGWAPGDYRVEFYVDDALTETAKLKISK